MCQMELFNRLPRLIIFNNYLKPYSCVQIIHITLEYFIKIIIQSAGNVEYTDCFSKEE